MVVVVVIDEDGESDARDLEKFQKCACVRVFGYDYISILN